MRPRVTIYIPCHNYGHYLREAIDSVVSQTYENWELLIISDGSTDDTIAISEEYSKRHPSKVRLFEHEKPLGLQTCANRALEESRGDYIMRLDADDYLDESACLVLSAHLDSHPDVGLVYPNYTYVDEQGQILGVESRKKVGQDAKLLDLPAHGACTMVRKRVLKTIGGYSEKYKAQDGHELWLKVLHRYPVANVRTPLFFYRQHSTSISKDQTRLLKARSQIKRDLVEDRKGIVNPRVVAVIPAKNSYKKLPNIVLTKVQGKRLIDYTLEAALSIPGLDLILVTTDDPAVKDYCEQFGKGIEVQLRPAELSREHIPLSQVAANAVEYLETERDIYPDIVTVLSVHSPLRRAEHIQKAIDTLLLYNTDSVVSVYESYDILYAHGTYGLQPLNQCMENQIRLERESVYVDNGAIRVFWRDVVSDSDIAGKKIGHIVMTSWDSLQIKRLDDLGLIVHLLNE